MVNERVESGEWKELTPQVEGIATTQTALS